MSRAKADAILLLAEQYRQKLSLEAVQMYVQGLASISDQDAIRATRIVSKSLRWFPSVSELLQAAGAAEANSEALAALAFSCLDRALDLDRPQDLDQLTMAVVRSLGGWQALRQMPCTEFSKWGRINFMRTYQAFNDSEAVTRAAIAGPQSELAQQLLGGAIKRLEDGHAESLPQRQIGHVPESNFGDI
jgi:hypothetical protein